MATTYYVDGAVGDDKNAGTSEGAGNAFKTISKATGLFAANDDHIYVKASATYNEQVVISTFSASVGHGLTLEGYTTTPGDGGQCLIDGNDILANGVAGVRNDYKFKNLKVIQFTNQGFNLGGPDILSFDNCEASHNGNRGFYTDNYATFINCKAIDNTNYGWYCDQYITMINCIGYLNGLYCVTCRSYTHFIYGCIFAGGSSGVMYMTGAGIVMNCTIDGRNSSNYGLQYGAQSYFLMQIMNNIIYDCDVGLYTSAILRPPAAGHNNVLYSNTTNYGGSYWDIPRMTGTDIIGDPSFVNSGLYDYTLNPASVAIGAAFPDRGGEERTDCGALQTALPSGGGTSRVVYAS